MAQTIPSGVYFGFTKTELQTELTRYKAAVKTSASNLIGASQNGQSYSFGPRQDMSLSDWQQELQQALAFFDLADDLAPPQTAVDFRTRGDCAGFWPYNQH
jgi:hypothetical protein